MEFDRTKINFLPLRERKSLTSLDVMIDPDAPPLPSKNLEEIAYIAEKIVRAKKQKRQIIMATGAHTVKNGLSLILRRMIEEGYITHIASNGAFPIHDWELAFQGKTEEDVEKGLKDGSFGMWKETLEYQNLALISGAAREIGYGEVIGEMINIGKLLIPENSDNILERTRKKLITNNIKLNEEIEVVHPFKEFSVLESAYVNNIPFTVHPHYGHDIIYMHPLCDGASIGICAEIDHDKFTYSVFQLEHGVYLSIGSAVMAPQTSEKSLSGSRNVLQHFGEDIRDVIIVINDLDDPGKWKSGVEPSKDDPYYYKRQFKSFKRTGLRVIPILEDNRSFLTNLYHEIRN